MTCAGCHNTRQDKRHSLTVVPQDDTSGTNTHKKGCLTILSDSLLDYFIGMCAYAGINNPACGTFLPIPIPYILGVTFIGEWNRYLRCYHRSGMNRRRYNRRYCECCFRYNCRHYNCSNCEKENTNYCCEWCLYSCYEWCRH